MQRFIADLFRQTEQKHMQIIFRNPVEPSPNPPPIKEPDDPPENPDVPIREPDPDEPNQI